jgi:methanogenic corrinoid protein MtbC1
MEHLLARSEKLNKVSKQASKFYDRKKGILADKVNQYMTERDDLEKLIGKKENLEVMYDNHNNHCRFISAVLQLNNGFRLLASVLPWVYLTYKNHGFSYDYFPAALKNWKIAIKNELPQNYAEEVFNVYDWLLSEHDFLTRACENLSSNADKNSEGESFNFLQALYSSDLNQALKIAHANVKNKDKVPGFYNNVVRPALYQVGEQWAQGKISVADEHIATIVAQTVMADLQVNMQNLQQRRRGKALVGAIVNEQHELGARMLAHCLELDGWEVFFLGANTPIEDFSGFVNKINPEFIALSVSMPYHLQYVQNLIDSINDSCKKNKIHVIVGGQVFKKFNEAVFCLSGAQVINDLSEAIEHVRKWGQI